MGQHFGRDRLLKVGIKLNQFNLYLIQEKYIGFMLYSQIMSNFVITFNFLGIKIYFWLYLVSGEYEG